MPRVAILGAGFMGGTHARAYQTLPDVEIAAIYARGPDRAAPLAAELGTRWTADLPALLADPSIDAVDVCLPTPDHRPATEAALAAGKHVLVEKPLALTEPDADALVARAAATDRVVMVAHVLRFWPEYVEIHRRLAAGDLGRPRSGFASRRQPFPAWSPLFARSDLTGGAVLDMLIHDYDVLNWLLGPPRAVTARGARNPRSGGFDQAQVLIDYADGASALVDGGMTMPESYPFSSRLEILAERGALEYAFRAGGRSVEMADDGGVNDLTLFPDDGDPRRLTPAQYDPYAAEIAYFLDCIRTDRPPARATPTAARLALRVALAAHASLDRGGETVPVSRLRPPPTPDPITLSTSLSRGRRRLRRKPDDGGGVLPEPATTLPAPAHGRRGKGPGVGASLRGAWRITRIPYQSRRSNASTTARCSPG